MSVRRVRMLLSAASDIRYPPGHMAILPLIANLIAPTNMTEPSLIARDLTALGRRIFREGFRPESLAWMCHRCWRRGRQLFLGLVWAGEAAEDGDATAGTRRPGRAVPAPSRVAAGSLLGG